MDGVLFLDPSLNVMKFFWEHLCQPSLFQLAFEPSCYDFMANIVDQDDNFEHCAACGGTGRLLCCDGCPKSFHFSCLDPPQVEVAQDEIQDEDWYCPNCLGTRDPQIQESKGLWSQLKTNFNRQNPVAYALPRRYRDYYEGVATGEDGEYLDVALTGKTR